jgi:hypothetical protein
MRSKLSAHDEKFPVAIEGWPALYVMACSDAWYSLARMCCWVRLHQRCRSEGSRVKMRCAVESSLPGELRRVARVDGWPSSS